MTKRAKKIRAATAAPSPIAADIADAAAIAASVRVEVAGEGMLAETRRIVTGPALEGEIRRHFRAHNAALDAAGDPFAALFAPALENARAIIAACTEQPPARNSEADIAARMIARYELAIAADARGDNKTAMALGASALVLAARIDVAGRFNNGIISRAKQSENMRTKNEENRLKNARAKRDKYAAAQIVADRLMREKPTFGQLAIAEEVVIECKLTEKPDTVKRNLSWPDRLRRPRAKKSKSLG